MASSHSARGADDGQDHGRGNRRLSAGARAARGTEGRGTRIARLAARVDAPLPVTGLVDGRHLSGLASPNAPLLVDPDGEATLYTDFRYAEAAREVDDVAFHQTPRAVVPALAELLSGRRVAVEAQHLALASAETLRAGGVELVSTTGVVEGLRAVKEREELDALRRAAAISDRVYDELAHQPFVGRTEAELAWWLEQAWHEGGADGPAFDAI